MLLYVNTGKISLLRFFETFQIYLALVCVFANFFITAIFNQKLPKNRWNDGFSSKNALAKNRSNEIKVDKNCTN